MAAFRHARAGPFYRRVLGHDHVASANDHPLVLESDGDLLAGALGRHAVTAAIEAHEAVLAGLTRHRLVYAIRCHHAQQSQLLVRP